MLSVIAGVWLLINVLPILLVLVTALMLVGALSPFVTWLEQRNVRRAFALCTVFRGRGGTGPRARSNYDSHYVVTTGKNSGGQ